MHKINDELAVKYFLNKHMVSVFNMHRLMCTYPNI